MTETAPRLLIVSKTLDIGGAERLIADFAARRRDLVEVAYLAGNGALAGELKRRGIPVHDLSSRGRLSLKCAPKLHALLRGGRFDLVHAHLPLAGIAARLVRGKTPLVYTEHNVWEVYHPLTRWLNRVTFRANDHVVAVSADVAASIGRGWPHVSPIVTVVLNGIAERPALLSRDEVRLREGIAPGDLLLLSIGNLFSRKGHDVLLEALALIADRAPELRLWIVGDGDERATLERLVSARGLSGRVRLLGLCEDVGPLLGAADGFVLASRYEGLPVALLEAMAVGLPCVATAVGGMPEALADGTGILVPTGSPQALAQALFSLRSPDTRRCLGEAALRRVRERFSAETMDRRLEEIFRAACKWGS